MAWCTQLGGLAALQAECSSDVDLSRNRLAPVFDMLTASQKELLALSQMPSGSAQQVLGMQRFIARSYPEVIRWVCITALFGLLFSMQLLYKL